MPTHLAIIGPCGAGKGTQAERLLARHDLHPIATSDLLRRNPADQTELGQKVRNYMERGELVPNEIVDALIEVQVWQIAPERGILFEGFPRTVYQAQYLDDVLQSAKRRLDAVIFLQVPDDRLIVRLQGRRVCQQCQRPYHLEFKPPIRAGRCDVCGGELVTRPDDQPAIVERRLRTFAREAAPLAEYYRRTNRLRVVDGSGDIETVQRAIVSSLAGVDQSAPAPAAITVGIPSLATVPKPATGKHLDLVLLGGPGCGKGTQAEKLCQQFAVPHIATGDLFRENLKGQTALGKLAKTYMDRGELVPDDITESMVQERLTQKDAQAGFILDGFPRTLPQAEALQDMLQHLQRELSTVLYLRVSDEDIVTRLSGRLICRQCQTPYHRLFKPPQKPGICDACGGELYQRDDDNPATVMARLKTFHQQTEPLIAYYRAAGLLVEVSGEGALTDVTARVAAAVQEIDSARTLVSEKTDP